MLIRFTHVPPLDGDFPYHSFHGCREVGGSIYAATDAEMDEVVTWCESQFGSSGPGNWRVYRNQIIIWQVDDVFAFKMRWC